MNDNGSDQPRAGRLGVAGWITLAALAGFLAWAGWYAVHAWNALSGVGISAAGWVFILLGVLFTTGLGAGLMALVFYSNRKDFDR